MRYPVAIEIGSDAYAYGVVFPDLPGCVSAGDTLDEAMTNAEEAVADWMETLLRKGGTVPVPSRLEAVRTDPEYAGWALGVVNVDLPGRT